MIILASDRWVEWHSINSTQSTLEGGFDGCSEHLEWVYLVGVHNDTANTTFLCFYYVFISTTSPSAPFAPTIASIASTVIPAPLKATNFYSFSKSYLRAEIAFVLFPLTDCVISMLWKAFEGAGRIFFFSFTTRADFGGATRSNPSISPTFLTTSNLYYFSIILDALKSPDSGATIQLIESMSHDGVFCGVRGRCTNGPRGQVQMCVTRSPARVTFCCAPGQCTSGIRGRFTGCEVGKPMICCDPYRHVQKLCALAKVVYWRQCRISPRRINSDAEKWDLKSGSSKMLLCFTSVIALFLPSQ